jgi:EAL domain-containing protein (putative c-di-GMP-specific phosphodiesterase class I)
MAVNVAVQQLEEPDFSITMARLLREAGLPAPRLELEVAEADLVRHEGSVTATLQRLRLMGVGLAVDDFGAGPSALGRSARPRTPKRLTRPRPRTRLFERSFKRGYAWTRSGCG